MKCISVLIFLTGCSGGGAFSGSGIADLPGDAGTGSGGSTATGGTAHSSGGALDGGTSAGGTTSSLGSGGTTSGGGATATGGATASGGTPGAGGSSSTCSSGAARCSSTIPTLRQTCVVGAWVSDDTLCSGDTPVCLSGACVACNPGAKSCASATQPETCDASGAWAPNAACPAATPLCSDGACSAICCKLPIGIVNNPVPCSSNAWICVVPWQGGGGSNYSCTEQGRCTPGLTCGYTGGPYAGTYGTVAACP